MRKIDLRDPNSSTLANDLFFLSMELDNLPEDGQKHRLQMRLEKLTRSIDRTVRRLESTSVKVDLAKSPPGVAL
ncbi:hypothetical protein ACRQ1B_15780 [Rhizobium panacihumi]|uniref:hypothetical protein n=1 Tax=Rhizobium panacihumi TaxID=2008450 RepID=UPI003D7A9DF2